MIAAEYTLSLPRTDRAVVVYASLADSVGWEVRRDAH